MPVQNGLLFEMQFFIQLLRSKLTSIFDLPKKITFSWFGLAHVSSVYAVYNVVSIKKWLILERDQLYLPSLPINNF